MPSTWSTITSHPHCGIIMWRIEGHGHINGVPWGQDWSGRWTLLVAVEQKGDPWSQAADSWVDLKVHIPSPVKPLSFSAVSW